MTGGCNEQRDVWGNKYWEDENGNRIYEREDMWGNRYRADAQDKRIPDGGDGWDSPKLETGRAGAPVRDDIWGDVHSDD